METRSRVERQAFGIETRSATRVLDLTWRRAAGALTAAKEKRTVWADIFIGVVCIDCGLELWRRCRQSASLEAAFSRTDVFCHPFHVFARCPVTRHFLVYFCPVNEHRSTDRIVRPIPTKNKQTLKPSSARAAHPFTTRTPARSTNSGNMAAEQNEKAYQKQLGVNVGCVSQPRLNPRASPARASPCFFPSTSRAQALTPSRLSSLPTASAPRARRRVPARTVPATTRTSVLASRPRVRLSRVSRPHHDREARSGVALDFQGSLGLEAAPRFLGSRRAARGPARGRTWTRFVCESRHDTRLDRPRLPRAVRRAIAPRRARRWGPCQPPHPAPRAASQR